MAVPAGGEIAIYNATAKRTEVRVAIGLDYPALTAQKQDLFGSGAEPAIADWWFTQLGGSVLVSGGSMLIRSKGGPSYEIARTREHWFPADPLQPFEIEFNVTFPQTDPIYSPMITIGSLQQTLGAGSYDTIIRHVGAVQSQAYPGNAANIDNIDVISGGAIPHSFANDQMTHEYIVQWDPLKAVNSVKFTLSIDGSPVVESDNPSAPRYLAFGWAWATKRARTSPFAAIAALEGIETLIDVQDVTSRELGSEGYETRSYPGWTSANDGGTTVADSAEGERFVEDGETWAIVPAAQIKAVSGTQDLDGLANTFSLTLFTEDQSNPNAGDVFAGSDRYPRRPITIDTRTSSESSAAAWKRRMAGRILLPEWDDSSERATLTLSGRCRVMDGLDVFISKSFTGESALGEAHGVEYDKNFTEVLEDLVDVADKVDGGPLGARDVDITATDVLPSRIDSGGESLLPVFATICEQLAQEFWVEYETSGTGRYGLLHVNAHTLGAGSAGYTFNTEKFLSGRVAEDVAAGPGMVSLRQNRGGEISQNTLADAFGVPNVGNFPNFPYPATARILSDSIAFARDVQATSIQALTDKDGGTINGGIAMHRWRAENVRRRMVQFTCTEHDWIEPTDEIAVSVRGALSGETWVVSSVAWSLEDGRFESRVVGYTSDWMTAVTRAS